MARRRKSFDRPAMNSPTNSLSVVVECLRLRNRVNRRSSSEKLSCRYRQIALGVDSGATLPSSRVVSEIVLVGH